jgi:hypothetical protein
MTDNDKALDKIIRTSMPFDFERKETLSDDKALVERLRNLEVLEYPHDRIRAANRIEAQAEDNERLRELLNAWTELAREYLDTELAGRTFAALRDANHG